MGEKCKILFHKFYAGYCFCTYRISRKGFLGDIDISFALNCGSDSDNGLDFDDDRLVDPDFLSELGTLEGETPEENIDVDSIIETEKVDGSLFFSTATASVLGSTAEFSQAKKPRTISRAKLTKLNLRWNLHWNTDQLMFMGSKTRGPD